MGLSGKGHQDRPGDEVKKRPGAHIHPGAQVHYLVCAEKLLNKPEKRMPARPSPLLLINI